MLLPSIVSSGFIIALFQGVLCYFEPGLTVHSANPNTHHLKPKYKYMFTIPYSLDHSALIAAHYMVY